VTISLHHRAGAEARNAEVAALTLRASGRAVAKAVDRLRRHEIGCGLTAGVDGALAGVIIFSMRAGGFALGDGGLHAIHEDDRGDEVAQHGAAMAGVSA
jgi:hypothetical protein